MSLEWQNFSFLNQSDFSGGGKPCFFCESGDQRVERSTGHSSRLLFNCGSRWKRKVRNRQGESKSMIWSNVTLLTLMVSTTGRLCSVNVLKELCFPSSCSDKVKFGNTNPLFWDPAAAGSRTLVGLFWHAVFFFLCFVLSTSAVSSATFVAYGRTFLHARKSYSCTTCGKNCPENLTTPQLWEFGHSPSFCYQQGSSDEMRERGI